MKFSNGGIFQVILICTCFSGLLSVLVLILGQLNNLIYPGDIAVIIVMNILGGMFLNHFTTEKNKLIIPILTILTLTAGGMLAISMFIIPNYISFSLSPINMKLFGDIEFHPYGFFFFVIIFCLSNSILLVLKYLARVTRDFVSKSSIYTLFGFSITFAVLLGGVTSFLTPIYGWIYFMPFFGIFLFLVGIILLNFHLHKQNWFINILQNPKMIRHFGTRLYYRENFLRDFFGIFGVLFMTLSVILLMSVSMNPASTPILLGDMSWNSLNFIFIFSLIAFVFYRILKNIFLMIFPLILGSLFIFLHLKNTISWGIPALAHSTFDNLLLGISFAIGIFSFLLISIERISENGGSSRLLNVIWLLFPFFVALILHFSFSFTGNGTTNIKDFNILFGILVYGSICLLILQMILRGINRWKKKVNSTEKKEVKSTEKNDAKSIGKKDVKSTEILGQNLRKKRRQNLRKK